MLKNFLLATSLGFITGFELNIGLNVNIQFSEPVKFNYEKEFMNELYNLKKTKVELKDFPDWFIDEINKSKNINHSLFIETFCKQPSLHLVFKSEKYLNDFKEPNAKSSSKSAFLKIQRKVSDVYNFNKGEWWVQDFSSMIPLAINKKMKNYINLFHSMVSEIHFWDNLSKIDKIEKLSIFLEDFNNIEDLLKYFEEFNSNLSKKTLNSFLKSVSNP